MERPFLKSLGRDLRFLLLALNAMFYRMFFHREGINREPNGKLEG